MPGFTIPWGDQSMSIEITVSGDGIVSLTKVEPGIPPADPGSSATPLIEVVTARSGKRSGGQYIDSRQGRDLRYTGHDESTQAGMLSLRVGLADPHGGLEIDVRFSKTPGIAAITAWAVVTNRSPDPVLLLFVSSLAVSSERWDAGSISVRYADSSWLAENRWRSGSLADLGLPDINKEVHAPNAPRGRFALTSTGTWSSGIHTPMGAIVARDDCLIWQVETNGAWHAQIGERAAGSYLIVSGPTDLEHQWNVLLKSGETFDTVSCTIAGSTSGFEGALAALTDHRRRSRYSELDGHHLPVIFNDYMNTLMADPTSEKLLPLIAAVGRTGADIFCVDAGWYSDAPGWWDSVGEWTPSSVRFPDGIDEVFRAIRAAGMQPGLWMEPEVVGVKSPVADLLPDTAFFSRRGQRVVEDGRYQLDFRSPDVVERMNDVVDRLIDLHGLAYLKFDYNINPGSGTDAGGASAGEGLLGANRGYLEWVRQLRVRHPGVLFENCASGGMRADWSTMSLFSVLSTSDQQDALTYVPIAASVGTLVPLEQAGVWSYPQPGMSVKEASFALSSALLARPVLAGRFDLMDEAELGLVRSAVSSWRSIRRQIPTGHAHWPLGLPEWNDAWVVSGITDGRSLYVTAWRRFAESEESLVVPLPDRLVGDARAVIARQVFPPPELNHAVGCSFELGEQPASLVIRLSPGAALTVHVEIPTVP